jgi:DnaA family protein
MLKFHSLSRSFAGAPGPSRTTEFSGAAQAQGHPMRQLLLDFTQAPAPTFANFVHGRNAELAHALESAARGETAERVIYIWGEPAAGKTHLLRAFVEAAGPGARHVPAAAFEAADATGILAIDDVHLLPDERQVALFNAFNERAFTLLVASAPAAPRDVSLRRDLATRLATGLTYRVLGLTDAEKRAALEAHARARGFALADEVGAYLLTHARRDMGSLVAALDSLDRYSLETGRPITVPLLKAALGPSPQPSAQGAGANAGHGFE